MRRWREKLHTPTLKKSKEGEILEGIAVLVSHESRQRCCSRRSLKKQNKNRN